MVAAPKKCQTTKDDSSQASFVACGSTSARPGKPPLMYLHTDRDTVSTDSRSRPPLCLGSLTQRDHTDACHAQHQTLCHLQRSGTLSCQLPGASLDDAQLPLDINALRVFRPGLCHAADLHSRQQTASWCCFARFKRSFNQTKSCSGPAWFQPGGSDDISPASAGVGLSWRVPAAAFPAGPACQPLFALPR